ncbi:GyrI-like domain-containing protein [Bacillus infantis]|uniref:GyrI-like domain-containing protein n=1 Tax=Bacillus infantis TaxID=324767 RepID=UPI003CEC81DE
MKYKEVFKKSFVIVGYSSAGKWNGDIVYPIPQLWDRANSFLDDNININEIVGVYLPPRSDHYYYTCGIEIESVDYFKIGKDMTLHTFPEQKYVVFKHIGPSKKIPNTYGNLWRVFDEGGYRIKEGMPEIEILTVNMIGKEESEQYEMEIWVPVQ